jgi:hypothetical protein
MATPYEVAIHLTVTGNAQAGLAGLSQQMNKLNQGAKDLHKAFALIFTGGEMKRWGEETLGGVKKVLDAAGNLQQVQNQMASMGMTQKDIAASVASSWALAKDNIHVSVQELAIMNRHAVEIFGSATAAAEHMPEMAKLAEFQARWSAGHTGLKQVDVASAIRDMAKTTEGAAMLQKDPKVFDQFAEKLMRSLIAAGGNVSATQYLQAQRHARAAAFGWEDSFRFGIFPAMAQEYGPNAGVMLQQAFVKLAAGAQWTATGIAQGIEMGLIDKDKVKYDTTGRPMRLKPGAMQHTAEFSADPLKYTEQYITPWLDAHTKTLAERTQVLTRLLGRSTASSSLIAFDTQAFKYEKDRALFGQAQMKIPDGYAEALTALQAKWQDFITALGTPSLTLAASALGGVTKAIVALTGAINAHPEAAKNLLAIATGFGIAMTALGALAICAGIAGLLGGGVVIVGLTALTGGLAGLAAANWPSISSGIQSLIDRLNDLSAAVRGFVAGAFEKVIGWVKSFGDAISELWGKIKSLNPFHASYEGGGIGGGGITNAAWSGGEGSAGRALAAGERAQYASMIRQYGGAQADNLLKIYGSEGAAGYVGDYGTSFGPFQSHIGGLSSRPGMGGKGIGDQMLAAGIDPRDKSTVRAQIEWMRRYGETHGGYSSDIWHGLRGHGGSLRAAPHHLPPPRGTQSVENHIHNIYMDGTKIATAVSKRFVQAAQYNTSVGRQDGRGVFQGPASEVFA